MRIWIDVQKYLDWKMPGTLEEHEEDLGIRAEAVTGAQVVRVLSHRPDTTEIDLPQVEIDDWISGLKLRAEYETDEEAVASYIARVVMPQHSPREHWTGIRCDDPAMEAYLKRRFGFE